MTPQPLHPPHSSPPQTTWTSHSSPYALILHVPLYPPYPSQPPLASQPPAPYGPGQAGQPPPYQSQHQGRACGDDAVENQIHSDTQLRSSSGLGGASGPCTATMWGGAGFVGVVGWVGRWCVGVGVGCCCLGVGQCQGLHGIWDMWCVM